MSNKVTINKGDIITTRGGFNPSFYKVLKIYYKADSYVYAKVLNIQLRLIIDKVPIKYKRIRKVSKLEKILKGWYITR